MAAKRPKIGIFEKFKNKQQAVKVKVSKDDISYCISSTFICRRHLVH
jgi:hypothetical protein